MPVSLDPDAICFFDSQTGSLLRPALEADAGARRRDDGIETGGDR
jgi:hypothetical protein